MIHKEFPLNPADPKVSLSAYLLEPAVPHPGGSAHPVILVVPGGGEPAPAQRWAESLALEFAGRGCQTFVLHAPEKPADLPPTPFMEGFTAIACIRDHAAEWNVDPARLIVCGFSTGGALAWSLLTHWKHAALIAAAGRTPLQLKPDAGLLYNAIFPVLPGSTRTPVDGETPPVFLWVTPGEAPAAVSALEIAATMLEKNRPVELHVLGQGSLLPSGEWFEHAVRWIGARLHISLPMAPESASPIPSQGLEEKNGKPAQYYRNIFNDREGMFRHSPFSLEQDLVRHVINGDDHAALDTLARISQQGNRAVLAKDPLRSAKNSMICSCTFLTRAAIQAGVSDEEAFALSDASIQHVESLESERVVLAYEAAMLLQFIGLVKMRQDKIYSTPVRKALHYVASNLEKPFHLAAVASYARVHPNYLSRRFKQETGSTLSSYATTRKIHEATYFVQHTEYSMADIAVLYGFSSQSHFSSTFKKVFLIAPGEYRNRSRNS